MSRCAAGPVTLSVVVPVYACADCLERLWARMNEALDAAAVDFEVVFVNDASRDHGGQVLARLAQNDRRVHVVLNATNQGQHASIALGVAQARGRWVAVMDCDLQDPPEALLGMLALAQQGADIVVGRRRSRSQPAWRVAASVMFAALVRVRRRSHLVGTHSVFSVLSREAVGRYLGSRERTVMYLGVLSNLRLPLTSFDYDRGLRLCGASGYGPSRLFSLAWRILSLPGSSSQRRRGAGPVLTESTVNRRLRGGSAGRPPQSAGIEWPDGRRGDKIRGSIKDSERCVDRRKTTT